MTGEFENLQTLIHEEWCHYGHDVAHRLLTKGLAAAPNLTAAERDHLRKLLDQQLSASLKVPPPVSAPPGQDTTRATIVRRFKVERVDQIVADAMHAPRMVPRSASRRSRPERAPPCSKSWPGATPAGGKG
ncbi:MAG: hypothetical protein RIS54_512 [Verrucomicrobiota bacterium]|jgi:hypothetical protein